MAGALAATLFEGSGNASAVMLAVGAVSNVTTVTTSSVAPAAVAVVQRSRITLLALLCLLCCVPTTCCAGVVYWARAARARKHESVEFFVECELLWPEDCDDSSAAARLSQSWVLDVIRAAAHRTQPGERLHLPRAVRQRVTAALKQALLRWPEQSALVAGLHLTGFFAVSYADRDAVGTEPLLLRITGRAYFRCGRGRKASIAAAAQDAHAFRCALGDVQTFDTQRQTPLSAAITEALHSDVLSRGMRVASIGPLQSMPLEVSALLLPPFSLVALADAPLTNRPITQAAPFAPGHALEEQHVNLLAAAQPTKAARRMQGIMGLLTSRKRALREALEKNPRVSRASSGATDLPRTEDNTAARQQLLELLRLRRLEKSKPTRMPATPISVSAWYSEESNSAVVAAAIHALADAALAPAPPPARGKMPAATRRHEDDAPADHPSDAALVTCESAPATVMFERAAAAPAAASAVSVAFPDDAALKIVDANADVQPYMTHDLELGLVQRDHVEPRLATGEGRRHDEETATVAIASHASSDAEDVEAGRVALPRRIPSRSHSNRAHARSSAGDHGSGDGGRGGGHSAGVTARNTAASRLARSQSAPPTGVQWKY
jgi:hypothetical protein